MITIIVPVYNVEPYLDRCVESLCSQTMSDIEVILVDDGSTDKSGELCEKWGRLDERIRVVHKENGGLSSARNAGLDVANGEFIGFVDSDDYVEKDMYQLLYQAICATGKDMACCGQLIELGNGKKLEKHVLQTSKIYDNVESIRETLIMKEIDVSACDKLYRKKLFEKIRYPEGKISEDAAIIFELLNDSNGIVHIGKPLYHYVYRTDSISKVAYNHKKYDAYINCVKTESYIGSLYPHLKKYCNMYSSQISGFLLESMILNKDIIRMYNDDYCDYLFEFKKGFVYVMLEPKISWKVKVRFLFLRLNIYSMFIKLKNVR